MRGHCYDALVGIAGCDKSLPGMMMSMLRLNVPSVFLYGGSIMPGKFKGRDVTVVDIFEGVGQFAAGKMSAEDLLDLECHACPGAGACGGQFTANTMACVAEAIGLALPYSSGPPAEILARDDFALKAGEAVMALLARNIRPRDDLHPRSVRECGRRGGGHRRLDQCGAASARDGERGRHRVRPVRCRGDLQAHALSRVAEAGRRICRQGHVGSGRRAHADAHAARWRLSPWRLHDGDRQDRRRKSQGCGVQSEPEGDEALERNRSRRQAALSASKATSRPKARS